MEQNAIRYDGIEGSPIVDAAPGNLNGEVATPFKLQASLENVQEFRVESSAYPAEFGTGSGGQVSVITSGPPIYGMERRSNIFATTHSTRRTTSTEVAKLPKSDTGSSTSLAGRSAVRFSRTVLSSLAATRPYRLTAGINIIEGVPSAAAWSRAVPAMAALRPGFLAPGAVILDGKSTNPDLDFA